MTYTDLKGCIAKAATQEVTINAVPSITTQPIGSTVCFGTEILLSVIATGKDGTSSAMDLTYAWKKVGSNTALSNSKNYTFIPSVLEAGQYFVEISGSTVIMKTHSDNTAREHDEKNGTLLLK